jgi:hypothetical protein
VAATIPEANIKKFVVVDSEELAQFHGITDVPRKFVFATQARLTLAENSSMLVFRSAARD